METTRSITNNIYKQLGGRKFSAMADPRYMSFMRDENDNAYLSFRLPRICNNINYIRITYIQSDDSYTMEFGKIRGSDYSVRYKEHGFCAEDLRRNFTVKTGLDTHL